MSEQQLWLFPPAKPLRDRLGDAFFRAVPSCPGVYIMSDTRGRVVYVGQSCDLHQRLNSYKNLRADKDPRRLVRLARTVQAITWEPCQNALAARLRENELLRLHRPKFNTMNTRPEAYGFIGLSGSTDAIELWLTTDASAGDALYGAFKGHRLGGYAALLRTLFVVLAGSWDAERFPHRLLSLRPPRRFTLPCPSDRPDRTARPLCDCLQRFLAGESPELVALLRTHLPSAEILPTFWRQLQEADLQAIEDFFERGPKRNRSLKVQHGIEERLIAPAQLDDLLVGPPRSSRAEAGALA